MTSQTQTIEVQKMKSILAHRLVGKRYRTLRGVRRALRNALKDLCQNAKPHLNYVAWDWGVGEKISFTVRCNGKRLYVDLAYAIKFLEMFEYPMGNLNRKWFNSVMLFEDEALKYYKEICKEEIAYIYIKDVVLNDDVCFARVYDRCGSLRHGLDIPVEIKIEEVFVEEIEEEEEGYLVEFCWGEFPKDFILVPDTATINKNDSK